MLETRELTEYEKTILELWKTNGRKGVAQYLVHEGMTDDEAQEKITTFDFLTPETENIIPKPTDPNAGLATSVENAEAVDELNKSSFEQTKETFEKVKENVKDTIDNVSDKVKEVKEKVGDAIDTATEKMTVTFKDGSTKDIDVGPGGVVVGPNVTTSEPLAHDTVVEDHEVVSIGTENKKSPSFIHKIFK